MDLNISGQCLLTAIDLANPTGFSLACKYHWSLLLTQWVVMTRHCYLTATSVSLTLKKERFLLQHSRKIYLSWVLGFPCSPALCDRSLLADVTSWNGVGLLLGTKWHLVILVHRRRAGTLSGGLKTLPSLASAGLPAFSPPVILSVLFRPALFVLLLF